MEIGLRQSEVNGNPARGGVEKVAAVGAEDGRSCLINARRLGFCADQSGTDRRSQGSAPAKPLQGRVVAPEHPANLLEERGVCHRICRYGAAVRAALMPASAPITSLRLIRSPRRRAGEEMLADQCRVPWRL